MIRSVVLILTAAALAGCAQVKALNPIGPSVVIACADRPFGMLDARGGNSDYGCSTARNLAEMVANPEDLTGGKDIGPPKGAAAFLAVERHAKGEDKPLPVLVGASPIPPQTQGK